LNIKTYKDRRTVVFFWALPLLIISTLTNCALEPVPPCPSIRVDTNTSQLIKYKNNTPSKPENIAHTAEILSYEGNCSFSSKGVAVKFDIDLLIQLGPKSEIGALELFYFIAVPQYFPDPNGKNIFVRNHQITDKTPRREIIREKNIEVFLPLENKLRAAAYDIYIGFQLANHKLEKNRAQK